MEDLFTVTDLATEFGITPRAVRFYESKGLIESRRVGRTRIYTKREKARLKIILRGKACGFKLADTKRYLDLYYSGRENVTQSAHLLHGCRRHAKAIEDRMTELQLMLDATTDLADAAIGELKDAGVDPESAVEDYLAKTPENKRAPALFDEGEEAGART